MNLRAISNARRLALVIVLAVGAFASQRLSFAQTLAEALDTTNVVWTTGGYPAWTAQTTNTHDGIDAVLGRGGSPSGWMEASFTGPATLHFWVKAVPETEYSIPQAQLWLSSENNYTENYFLGYSSSDWTDFVVDLWPGTNLLQWSMYGGPGFVVLDEVTLGPLRPPSVAYQPMEQTIYSGDFVRFSCGALGSHPLRYQWRKDGVAIFGATNSSFMGAAPATTNDFGVYSVVVSNAMGTVESSNATLTVLAPSAPSITYASQGFTAYVSQFAYLSAGVAGSPPFTFHWRKDGTNFLTTTSTWPWDWNSTYLHFPNLSLTNAGNYTLVVTNEFGSAESAPATVTVLPLAPPVILRQPRSLEVAAGVNTWMAVMATGGPAPCHTWSRVGVTVTNAPPPGGILIPISGNQCQQPKRFTNAAPSDAGVYFATVTNLAGTNLSRGALLTVLPPISLVGSWTNGANDIVVTNGIAYLACGTNGLAILSVSNPAAPLLLSTFSTPGYIRRIAVADGRAFLAKGDAGVQILDVSIPSNPSLIGSYNAPGGAMDLAVRSNLVFVAEQNFGLRILSITNPATPTLIGIYQTNFIAHAVALAGNYAVVSTPPSAAPSMPIGTNVGFQEGLFVLDISNPHQPSLVVHDPAEFGRMVVRDQILYGIDGGGLFPAVGGNFRTMSLTNPAQPTTLGSYYFNWSNPLTIPRRTPTGNDVRVVNDLAYLVAYLTNETRLLVLNVRDLGEPMPVGYFTNSGRAHTLAVDGNFVYFAGETSPLQIVQTPFNPTPIGPPRLSASLSAGLSLNLHGRRGLHYDIESATSLANPQWQYLQTVLLTNDIVTLPLSLGTGPQFFRLKQLD